MKSFSDLLMLHKQLDELFFEHQRALIRGELETALEKLEAYESKLLDHIWDEEEVLIPIYGDRAEAPLGGSAEIFLNEHRKIREYLNLFKAEFTKLFAANEFERAVIFLLDSETTFKRLLVHYDTRERKFLYPLLDQVTTEQEKLSVFERLRLHATVAVTAPA
ncbi:MAG TPA: hemerythrin domain-containing protein [Pyrinomonadaceae bacterium]|nr:hemerythrin domain-containing protein [Pyrinomonadaceae bacterium]